MEPEPIQSKDATVFAKAYACLTDACISCHQALDHGAVNIFRAVNWTSAELTLAMLKTHIAQSARHSECQSNGSHHLNLSPRHPLDFGKES
jgi:hypothetical protein